MKSLLIIGAGEYGHLVKELAEDCGYDKIAFLDDNSPEAIGKVSDAHLWKEEYTEFSVAIGNPEVRENVIAALEGLFCLATLIHPLAYISKSAVLNHNCTVMGYSQVDCNAVVAARAVVPKGTKVESCAVWKEK